MAVNKWTDHINVPQSDLVDDLVVECIQIHGIDSYYLPRTLVNEDALFGEDTISKFTSQDILEMYVETVDGFAGEGDIIAKFGLEIRDNLTLIVSKRRFMEVVARWYDGITHPREGDLLYFPLNKGLFEIKWVEHEQPFYQFGKNYTYKMNAELFSFSHETIDTGVDDIDDIEDDRVNENDTVNDKFAQNEEIDDLESEDDVVDWNEKSPFGEF
jgi:hypothetical protein